MPIIKATRGRLLNKSHPLARGLVGYWPMCEGSGAKIFDLSNNGNFGESTGTALWSAGMFGGCIDYDGSSERHKVGYKPVLFCSPYMTVGFWAKSDVTNYTSNAYVISMYDYALGKRMWGICINASNDKWSVITSSNGTTAYFSDSAMAVDSSWHYFTFVVNNSTKQWDMYVDGLFSQSITAYVTYSDQQSFLTIGGLDGSNYFDGKIDNVSIWNRRLIASEISRLYREPFCMFDDRICVAAICYPSAYVDVAGSCSAQSSLAGKLTVSCLMPESERPWQQDALFAGMTDRAFKLGTVLTFGWFWMRVDGCMALYRGSSMEQIDFKNILGVAETDAVQIKPPDYIPHEAGSIYFYVVRRFNGCGLQERTLSVAAKVAMKSDGSLQEPLPNKNFAANARQTGDDKIRLDWFYCPLEQKSPPVCFRLYYDNASGQIDYENPLATIEYKGRKFYSYEISQLAAGRYLFAVRVENADGFDDDSQARMEIQLADQNPEPIEILDTAVI